MDGGVGGKEGCWWGIEGGRGSGKRGQGPSQMSWSDGACESWILGVDYVPQNCSQPPKEVSVQHR